jgi:hypothetical protein
VLTGQVRHGALTGDAEDGDEKGRPDNVWVLFAVLLQKGLLPGARARDGVSPREASWKPMPADLIEGGSAVLSGLRGRQS